MGGDPTRPSRKRLGIPVQPVHGNPVKHFVMDGDSTHPSRKRLSIPIASRLPVAEGETLAVGVSTRMFGVMDVGSRRTEASQSPGSRGVYACAQSEGWRFFANCGFTIARGGMSDLGSLSPGSSFQCDDWWLEGVRQERAWHP